MIALNESNPAAAEVPFFLPLASDPVNSGLANHTFTLGEVQLQLPGGAFFNVAVSQIVEKTQSDTTGLGQYAVQLTSAQTKVAGIVCVRAVVSGAQPYNGVEQIGNAGGDIGVGVAGAIPFFLPDPVNPIFNPPVTGHAFVAGEVKLVIPQSNTYIDIDPTATPIAELGNGYYTCPISAAQSAVRGKAYVYVKIAANASQRFVGSASILDAAGGGGAPPVISNVTPAPGSVITPSTPIQFDVTDAASLLQLVLPALTIDQNAPPELAHNWDAYEPDYLKRSTRTAIANGYRYTIQRDGGWTAAPALEVFAVDANGNVLSSTFSWQMLPPATAAPGVIDAGSSLAPDSSIDVGVPYYHNQDDFLALADSILPDWYLDPLKAQSASDGMGMSTGSGYELLQAFAKMFELASLSVGRVQVLATLSYSSGGAYSTASVRFTRTSLGSGSFTVKAGTIVRTSKTSRGYQVVADVTFGSGDYFKDAVVRSLGQDFDYDVKGPVTTADGTVLPGEIDTLELPVLDPPFAEPNLFVSQNADATGGCPPALDQLGVDRGIKRSAGEADENYKKRALALPDTIAPNAIRRHLDAIFYQQMLHYDLIETWESRFNSCWNAPDDVPPHPIFGSLVELAYNDQRTDRFVPRWMGEINHRSAMVVVVPTFPTLADRGMAYNDPATEATTTRGTSVWNGPTVDSASYLSGVFNGADDTGASSRATFLGSMYELLGAIKGGGAQVDLVQAEADEVLPGAPYP